ncbi:hypothetical protein [Pseudarthrobacter sp. PS3-L1]|uniref:hypothetical protein n=1 Tax=Pseudarthrobacter sp. PS3-L1 TaxID=3046207 RepID=UPI0024B9DCB6|nr:hypothetical protein [Pseudarthrobacter sp. PS3-L1]MDJ0319538.1 hypothetical protein [Pseudarthrobacter sp. PS3-L1]
MIIFAVLALPEIAESKEGDIVVGYEEKGIDLRKTDWIWDTELGQAIPTLSSSTTSSDPNQYKYDLQCQIDETSQDVKCLPNVLPCPARAEDGKEGIPVVWSVAPRAIADPTWTQWTPAGAGPTCLYDTKPEDLLPRIAARILQDFRNLPVIPANLTLQPAPHTLKGAETNVYANAETQAFDVVILGQQVHVEATPTLYTYSYGDGSGLGPTESAGGPLPQEQWGTKTRTSHIYQDTGTYSVSVSTTFSGTYAVNNGPSLPITGNGEFASGGQTLEVWRSITRNFADDCTVNPAGDGCPGR